MRFRPLVLVVVSFFAANLHAQDGVPPVPGPFNVPAVTADAPVTSNVVTLHTNLPGHPTAAVPGLPGVEFKPSTTSSAQFDRPYGNAAGNVVFSALVNLATTQDEVVILDGVLLAREGTATPWNPLENYGLIDTRLGISSTGDVSFATNTSATVADEVIVRANTSGATLIAQEGSQIPSLAAGVNYGATLDTPFLLSNGTAGFVADLVTGPGFTTNDDEILLLGGTVLLREGVTIPTGQAGGATQALDVIDTDAVFTSADGAHWIAQGDLNGATTSDDVVIVDGGVVLQEASVVPGSGFASPIALNGLKGVNMDVLGGWMARGSNVDGQDWVVRNGAVVAKRGAPIVAGSAEAWSDVDFADCFFLHVANGQGHYVIGGVTNNPSTNNGVLVLDGTHVIARENDPIDLDGNSLFDDDAFFNTFGNDDGHLADTGAYYFMATIRNAAGAQTGQGFFVINLSLASLDASARGTAGADVLTINGFSGGGSRRVPIPLSFPITVASRRRPASPRPTSSSSATSASRAPPRSSTSSASATCPLLPALSLRSPPNPS